MKTKDLTVVHIFESPSIHDREEDRKEGYSLGEMLRISNINYYYYDIHDINSFSKSFELLITRTKKTQSELGAVTLHISMHGNKDGLGLTSGEFLTWEAFSEELKKFRTHLGQIKIEEPVNIKIAPIILHFSSCEGFNGHKIDEYADEDETLYLHVLGPTIQVSWNDSLIAYTTLYHNLLSHNVLANDAVVKMNAAANLKDVFKIKMGKKMFIGNYID